MIPYINCATLLNQSGVPRDCTITIIITIIIVVVCSMEWIVVVDEMPGFLLEH